MIKEWIKQYKSRNHFDPSSNEFVNLDNLVKILEGKVTNKGHSENSAYFIICRNNLEMLQGDGAIKINNLLGVFDTVFNESEWFGKFRVNGESQIIVPNKYDLLLDSQSKKVFLEATKGARYYGSGNLQLDKDLSKKVLRTDVGFKELKELVNYSCSNYQYAHSLKAWNI